MPSAAAKPAILPVEFALPEFTLPDVLPTDVAALTALLHAAARSHQELKLRAQFHVQHLLEQFMLARHRLFGASSEQYAGQASLFGATEIPTDATLSPPSPGEDGQHKPAGRPARGKRGLLSAALPRVEIVHDVPEAERTCPCGTPMVEIGQDVSEQLDIVPMTVRVLRHIRKRYGCPGGTHVPVTAPLPPQPLPKSNASVDFLALLLTMKFVDGLPVTRFGKMLLRHHAPVPDQTLARWVIGCAGVLQPVLNLMRDTLLEGTVLHIDETVLQVLKAPDKKPTSNSYMWVQSGGPPGKPVVIFDYDPSRSMAVPVRLLHDYRGYLMTDGYDGYNQLARTEGIERLLCWAHVRRRFVEAAKVQPKGKRGHADEALSMIGKLYRIERHHKDASDRDRFLARQQQSLPLLAELNAWMRKVLPAVPPKAHWARHCRICAMVGQC